ncbi:alpha-(1,6)-fucosyltransferase-like [Schistocerca cancellata]|uniref:alpha-(1,6)-fucosyltransferase-like n=1 Tax=Schistocerca cancellata TaxID=274614 RepID=UPI002118B2FC|nr:alpha-(1,6)-fucosyltransferase-like [Schistocerca cancellata]
MTDTTIFGRYDGDPKNSDRHYEELRVRLERTAKRVAAADKEDAKEISRLLVSDLSELWRLDGRDRGRRRLAKQTAELVQRRLRTLQNPQHCHAARRLGCHIMKCGFGCQMHQAVYCLIVAYGMERTLVFSDSTLNYADTRWDEVFQPLSNTCSHLNASDFPGALRDRLVVWLGAARGFLAHTTFHPPAVPADLLPTVRLFHGAPHAWWVGQVLTYLMRLQPRSDQLVRAALRRLNFTRPIVGIHVRRSDKLFHEAKYHAVDEYMAAVEDIYETLEITNGSGARKIYVATDDVTVFDEINKK